MTPTQLARELNISPKTLRTWLRAEWPPLTPYQRWTLTDEQVVKARERWSKT